MTNDFGVPLSQAFQERFKTFFGYNHSSIPYKVLKTVFILVFCIPMPLISIMELLVLSVFKFIGFLGEKTIGRIMGIFWIPIGLVLGLIYYLLSKIFFILFMICILPDFLYKAI